jgi:hypothetical protein
VVTRAEKIARKVQEYVTQIQDQIPGGGSPRRGHDSHWLLRNLADNLRIYVDEIVRTESAAREAAE